MSRTLSTRIARFCRSATPEQAAKHFKVSLAIARDAVYAWRTLEALCPLVADAEAIVNRIDLVGPPTGHGVADEGARLREERKRAGVTLQKSAQMLGISPRLLGLVETGKSQGGSICAAHDYAHKLARRGVAIDRQYVSTGQRRSQP